MRFSRAHLAIALGSAALLVLVFLGYLYWLSSKPPVLSRSEERDPLTQMPVSITMNPFRDRTIERTANSFISEIKRLAMRSMVRSRNGFMVMLTGIRVSGSRSSERDRTGGWLLSQ